MYQSIYRMMFTNDNDDNVIIHISDKDSGEGSPTFHELYCHSAGLKLSNDGEDKLSQIRSLRFTCSFIPTEVYNLSTFIAGTDDRWLIEVFLQSTFSAPIFTGFLIPEGTEEKFLDPGLFVVELTASDKLAILNEIPLTKPDGTIPKGKFKMIEYISWALRKTKLNLPIRIVYNLFEEHHSGLTEASFDTMYLDALTFETNINEREPCMSVLKKILLGCFITQVNSEWWIVRVDEMNDQPYRIYNFAVDGSFLGAVDQSLTKNIGINETIQLVKEDATIFPERQIKYAKQTFGYSFPQEIICNINFIRATENNTITVPADYKAYNPIECVTNGKNPHAAAPSSPEKPAYVRRKFESIYEVERLIVIPATVGNGIHFVNFEPFDVIQQDRIRFSVDRKLTSDHTTGGFSRDAIFKIRLRGNDGSYWSMIGNPTNGKVGAWKQGSGGFSVQSFDWLYESKSDDETFYQTHEVKTDPCPVDGVIDILLFQSDIYGHVNDTHFANLQLEYIPFVNGAYGILTGQFHKVSTSDEFSNNKDEQVYISDGQCPQWKGVIFRKNGSAYPLANKFYNYLAGTTGELGLDKFGRYQAFALWNQHNRIIRKFQGSLLGLDTDIPELPTCIHKFQFTAPSEASTGKFYQLLSYDMDLSTCEWSGTFADVYDGNVDKEFSSDYVMDYTAK